MGLNDDAWEKLFERYDIPGQVEQKGQFIISASQIKEYREPRLMTKFDHQVNLPRPFADHRLAILPITRGDYVISSFSAYQRFEPPVSQIKRISVPSYLQSLMPKFLVSEAIALNCASACGILEDFLEDEALVPTVSGRMSSGEFDFTIESAHGAKQISVSHSQIEIDAAYEGVKYLSLFEAKRDLSEDFLVRQLYYPFRVWKERVTKPVKPVFLIFSNGIFYLYQYEFEQPECYNSLKLVKQKNYAISSGISREDIETLLKKVSWEPEPELPFPQANQMLRIINLMELLWEKPMSRQDITQEYGFDPRQTSYYTDAGRYLGLMEKGKSADGQILFQLSGAGKSILQLEYRERQLAVAAQILKHRVFREAMELSLQRGEIPEAAVLVGIMKRCGLYHVEKDSTFFRRSSTVVGWLKWILGLIET